MIILLLAAVVAIITFLDISSNWLDDETKGILYFDTESDTATASNSAEEASDQQNSEASNASVTETDETATSAPDENVAKQKDSKPKQTTKKSSMTMKEHVANASGINEEELLAALEKEANAMNSSDSTYDISDLDELDEYGTSQNEIKSKSSPLSDEEAEAAVSNIFEKFKGSI